MKLKQSALIAGSLCLVFALQSCVKEKDLYEEKPVTYSEMNFELGGEYIYTEPLPTSRAGRDNSRDVVGIAVSMLVPNGATTTSKPYAYGIFELPKATGENLKLNVIDGYQYRVSCTMIRNAKDSLLTENGYLAPFDLERNGKILGTCLNKFVTAAQPEGEQFLYNIENAKIKTKSGEQNNYDRPRIERYHGLIEHLEADGTESHTLKLYRRYFGVVFKQTGLQEGKLRIQMDGAPTLYLKASNDKKATVETDLALISMRNLTASLPANGNPFTENVKLQVYFESDKANVEPELIMSTNVSFKRNVKHTLVLTNIDHMGTPSNLGIEIEEDQMQDDIQQDIPWQDPD